MIPLYDCNLKHIGSDIHPYHLSLIQVRSMVPVQPHRALSCMGECSILQSDAIPTANYPHFYGLGTGANGTHVQWPGYASVPILLLLYPRIEQSKR